MQPNPIREELGSKRPRECSGKVDPVSVRSEVKSIRSDRAKLRKSVEGPRYAGSNAGGELSNTSLANIKKVKPILPALCAKEGGPR